MSVLLGIAAGASIGSSIWGAISGNRRRRKARRKLKKQRAELDKWRNEELQQNYLDRADSQAAMRKVREYNQEAMDSLNTNAVKTGATDEAKVAAASKLNKNFASVVSQIAGLSSQHRDRVNRQWMEAKQNLGSLEISNLMDNSGMQNMVSGIANAGLQLASMYALGGAGKAPAAG